MENASKALLIAGGVLVTLAVVSIIMVIFNRGREFNEDQIKKFDQKKIAYHNSQFAGYDKEIQKSEFEKLIGIVIKNNKNIEEKEYEVSITYNSVKYSFNYSTDQLVNDSGTNIESLTLDSLDRFSCKTITNTYGIISEIHINKK